MPLSKGCVRSCARAAEASPFSYASPFALMLSMWSAVSCVGLAMVLVFVALLKGELPGAAQSSIRGVEIALCLLALGAFLCGGGALCDDAQTPMERG